MKKAKILTVLGVMIAMGLTGCKTGGNTNSESSKKPETTTSQPAPSTTAAPPALLTEWRRVITKSLIS